MKQLISIPILVIWIFTVIIIAGCDAQGIKSISDNQNNDGPSSPVFFHRQRAMASFRVSDQPTSDQQPEFGYRLRMPSQPNPKTYMDYNVQNNNNNNNDLMIVRPRPIIINKGETLESSSSTDRIRPLEYSTHHNDYQQQQREDSDDSQQSTFTGSNDNNFYGLPQPSSSFTGNVSQTHGSELNSSPIPAPVPEIAYYDINDTQPNQQNQPESSSRSFNGEHPDQRQIEWIRYIQRFQPIPNPIFNPVSQQQIIPATEIPVGTPVIFHRNGYRPVPEAGRPPIQNYFVQIPRPGGPLQSQHIPTTNRFQQVEIPQQRYEIVNSNEHQQQQRFILPKQQNAGQSFIREIRPMPTTYLTDQIRYLPPIPQLIRIGSTGNTQRPTMNVDYNSISESANNKTVGDNYQVTQEQPIITQTRIHTPVFVTDYKPPKEFKYTITRNDQSMVEQKQSDDKQTMIAVPIAQQRIDSGNNVGEDRFYQIPLAQPIRYFHVPPYMHPFPIDHLMRSPLYYSNDIQSSDYERIRPGQTHTLPVVRNQSGGQGGGPVTVTIEPIPEASPSTGSQPSHPIPVSQSKPINLVINHKNKNLGQPLRQAVFEPIDNVAYPSDFPESDLYGQPQQQQQQPILQVGQPLRQSNTYEPPKEYRNQIGQPLRQPGETYQQHQQNAGQQLRETDNYQPIYGTPSNQNFRRLELSENNANVDESSELEPGHPDYITGRGHQLNYNPQQFQYSSAANRWPVQQRIDNNNEYYQQQSNDGIYHHQTSS
ncbi:uncharacterized protein LOC113790542 isoform X2 [Dermatophagoides pteronyssinus]|uniref:uncharacterized protein LOC113790542 isoform X2 n=1 Tax=Dermatophagoides pteronyssinus TaxID=6956 RepID=UPI003F664692